MYGRVELKWITPDADMMIGHIARVSNLKALPEDDASKLIRFLIKHHHWSPFEMANMCVEINTTRDIGRQILRHRSFSFQEFSQRYAEVEIEEIAMREMRSKGSTNRQGSISDGAHGLSEVCLNDTARECFSMYRQAIDNGVAPECARSILPEGYTPTRMYMNGTIRSWIHYINERTEEVVQKEHRIIAQQIAGILYDEIPDVCHAMWGDD